MRTSGVLATMLAAATPGLGSLVARDSITAQVNFGSNTGTPGHLASGLLYGVPDAPNQVQDHWYQDMGFNYLRAGGAQLAAPARGWVWGLDEYKNRFASALSNYRTARKYNAKFVFLIHDLWGADGTQNNTTPYPGDNGDWTYWDQYFRQLASDMRKNDMIDDVIIDIWNEPDLGTVFWGRTQTQYLQYWGRAFNQFRTEFGSSLLLSGPAASSEPHPSNTWWTNYMSYIAGNNTIPDQWAWHMETGGGNMVESTQGLNQLLSTYNLPSKPININEYAVFNEQVPAGSAWWISQLERVNAIGLRGNWLSGNQLHDFLASLLSKPNAQSASYSYTDNNYYPNGDYQVYKYYNLNMTGHRVSTLPSDDGALDCYATVGSNKARVMVGVRLRTGTWTLRLNDLDKLGLPASGTLNVHTWGFPASINQHYGEIDGPVDLGTFGHPYTGGSVSFPIFQTDSSTAYVFEFDLPASNTTTTTTTATATSTTRSSTTTSSFTTTGSSSTTSSLTTTTGSGSTTNSTVTTGSGSTSSSTTTSRSSTITNSSTTTGSSTSRSSTATGSSTTTVSGSTTSLTSTTRSGSTTGSTGTKSSSTTTGSGSTTSSTTTTGSGSTTSSTTTTGSGSTTGSTTTTGSGSTTRSTIITGSSTTSDSTTTTGLGSTTISTSTTGSYVITSSTTSTGSATSLSTTISSTKLSSFTTTTCTTGKVGSSTNIQSWVGWSSSSTDVQSWVGWPSSSHVGTTSTARGQEWSSWKGSGSGSGTITSITLTHTYVVPCETGLTTLTTIVTTTHCGCTETPVPTIPVTVITITPSPGWSISTPCVATVPVQTGNVQGPAPSTVKNSENASTGPAAVLPTSAVPLGAVNAWSGIPTLGTSVTTNAPASGQPTKTNHLMATYTGGAVHQARGALPMIFPVIVAGIFW